MAAGSAVLAEGHRIAQARLGANTVNIMRVTLPLLDLANLDATTARWLRVVVPILRSQHRLSAQLAAQYMRAARALDLGLTAWTPIVAAASTEQITTSMTVTGPVEARKQAALGRLLPQIRDHVLVSTSGSAMRLTMQGGRDTIMASIAVDDEATGWARTGSGHSCAFCSMLISRGPVYKAESVDFRTHDHCSCGSRPVYGDLNDGWTDQARDLRDLWDTTTYGRSGTDAVNAFRQAVEGSTAA
jgi:hypothetical protein